jgi:hypothetical protein
MGRLVGHGESETRRHQNVACAGLDYSPAEAG